MNSRCIRGRWKPIFLYVKRNCYRRGRWIEDVIQGEGMEKDLHLWQQGEAEAAKLIESLTDPGDLICDPFLGSGATAAAAVKLGRRFIGCDIDPGAVAVARDRLQLPTKL